MSEDDDAFGLFVHRVRDLPVEELRCELALDEAACVMRCADEPTEELRVSAEQLEYRHAGSERVVQLARVVTVSLAVACEGRRPEVNRRCLVLGLADGATERLYLPWDGFFMALYAYLGSRRASDRGGPLADRAGA